jgi:hypothetical protein
MRGLLAGASLEICEVKSLTAACPHESGLARPAALHEFAAVTSVFVTVVFLQSSGESDTSRFAQSGRVSSRSRRQTQDSREAPAS